MLLLRGKLRKYVKFVNIFVYTIEEITAFFLKLKPDAQPKVTHAYYVYQL